MKKYELTKETVTISGKTLYRIRAVRDFGSVKTGEFGGYIEKEENLSHFDNAWVCGDAKVFGKARVRGNAQVRGNAWVYGNAQVCGKAKVSGNAQVCRNAEVSGNAWVFDNAWVRGNAQVFGKAWVCGNAQVCGNAWVFGKAWVRGNAQVCGNAWVCGNAEVSNTRHYFVQGPIGSRDGFATFYRTKDDTVAVKCGCFLGSLQEFVNQVEKTHKGNKYEKEYKLAAELAKVCIRLEGESK